MSATIEGVAESGATGSWDKSGKREYTATWKVKTTSASDGPARVLSAAGLPVPGVTSYFAGNDFDAEAICESLTPSRLDGRTLWLVTAKFATQPSDEKKRDEDGKPESDPFKWADVIELGGAQFTRPVEKAIYRSGLKQQSAAERPAGTEGPPMNSVHMVFSPPVEKDDTRLVLRITKFKDKFPTSHWFDYRDAINSDVWTFGKAKLGFNHTFEKYVCKLQPITGSKKYEGDTLYWEVTYELHVTDALGWRFQILDQGYHAAARAGDDDGHGGTVSANDIRQGQKPSRRLVDQDGQPLTEPVLLDGDGNVLDVESDPVYLEYSVYNEKPFAALGL